MAKKPLDSAQFERQQAIIDAIVLLVEDKKIQYMEACVLYSETANVEIETIAQIIKTTPRLKATIAAEATVLNCLKVK